MSIAISIAISIGKLQNTNAVSVPVVRNASFCCALDGLVFISSKPIFEVLLVTIVRGLIIYSCRAIGFFYGKFG